MKALKNAFMASLFLSLTGQAGFSLASPPPQFTASHFQMLDISSELALEILTLAHPHFYVEIGISLQELIDDYEGGVCSITQGLNDTYYVTDGGITIQILIESG